MPKKNFDVVLYRTRNVGLLENEIFVNLDHILFIINNNNNENNLIRLLYF